MFPFLIFFLSIQPVWLVPEITGFLFLSENVDPEWCTQVVEIVLYDFKERNVGLMILVFQYTVQPVFSQWCIAILYMVGQSLCLSFNNKHQQLYQQ